MNDDAALLRRYAEEGSEEAFTELVQRHVDLVYSAALRRTGGDAHRAADVAQQVFTTLAREARRLSRHAVLSGWLHTATRNAALNLMISEQRRRTREQAALDPALASGETPPDWERLRPVLDAAIDDLPEPDRAAVVLRFLEQRPFAEIGTALRISTDAARMRTERALDKLRGALARRGITSTAAALSALVSTQSVISAPAGLAASIATASLAVGGVGAGASLFTLSLATLMNLKPILTGAALLAAFGIGAYVGLIQNLESPSPTVVAPPSQAQAVAQLRQENLSLRSQVDQLKSENAKLVAPRPAAPPAPAVRPAAAAKPELSPDERAIEVRAKQGAMLNNLRQIASARDQYYLEYGRGPASTTELIGPTQYIRQLVPVDGEDYSNLPMGRDSIMRVITPGGIDVTYDPKGNMTTQLIPNPQPPPEVKAMIQRMAPAVEAALSAYKAAHGGKSPPQTEAGGNALLPYFSTPQEGADFVDYMDALRKSGHLPK